MTIKKTLPFLLLGLLCAGSPSHATQEDRSLLQRHCLGCHLPEANGDLSRISHQRKTPEGWEMTISRMEDIHGLNLGANRREVKNQLVKYLADTQGLAPTETLAYRYILEQQNNVQESLDGELNISCGRCHSNARHRLQRRDGNEWLHLMHFHLGQYPAIEYSLYARDRRWFDIAINNIAPTLAQELPLASPAWSQWQSHDKPSLDGQWHFSAYFPELGFIDLTMAVANTDAKDRYTIDLRGQTQDGSEIRGEGSALVYTGYEWRAEVSLNGERYRQVFAASPDGSQLTGRIFKKRAPSLGARLTAYKNQGNPFISDLWPRHIRLGDTATITLVGHRLPDAAKLTIPDGLSVTKVLFQSAEKIRLQLRAAPTMARGQYLISAGGGSEDGVSLAVFKHIDKLSVSPSYAVARVGGNGGSQEKLPAQFTATALDFGSDGIEGSADDVALGIVTPHWSVENWDAQAEHDKDSQFAGTIDPATGIFTPAPAGPNPARKYATNNAGKLRVKATLPGSDQAAIQDAQLIVTVQRWNNPPIK